MWKVKEDNSSRLPKKKRINENLVGHKGTSKVDLITKGEF
jgi:hypothetical protein